MLRRSLEIHSCTCISDVQDEAKKKHYRQKIEGYMDRAETIKTHVEQQKQGQNLGQRGSISRTTWVSIWDHKNPRWSVFGPTCNMCYCSKTGGGVSASRLVSRIRVRIQNFIGQYLGPDGSASGNTGHCLRSQGSVFWTIWVRVLTWVSIHQEIGQHMGQCFWALADLSLEGQTL